MTGNELLEYLKELPAETLEQKILFQVMILTTPAEQITGHVPIVDAQIVDSDRILTPDGLQPPEIALEVYNELKEEGETPAETLKEYMPFFCPKILSKDQLLITLQGLKGYKDPPPPEEPTEGILRPWGAIGEA
jgi:hypothetical protein